MSPYPIPEESMLEVLRDEELDICTELSREALEDFVSINWNRYWHLEYEKSYSFSEEHSKEIEKSLELDGIPLYNGLRCGILLVYSCRFYTKKPVIEDYLECLRALNYVLVHQHILVSKSNTLLKLYQMCCSYYEGRRKVHYTTNEISKLTEDVSLVIALHHCYCLFELDDMKQYTFYKKLQETIDMRIAFIQDERNFPNRAESKFLPSEKILYQLQEIIKFLKLRVEESDESNQSMQKNKGHIRFTTLLGNIEYDACEFDSIFAMIHLSEFVSSQIFHISDIPRQVEYIYESLKENDSNAMASFQIEMLGFFVNSKNICSEGNPMMSYQAYCDYISINLSDDKIKKTVEDILIVNLIPPWKFYNAYALFLDKKGFSDFSIELFKVVNNYPIVYDLIESNDAKEKLKEISKLKVFKKSKCIELFPFHANIANNIVELEKYYCEGGFKCSHSALMLTKFYLDKGEKAKAKEALFKCETFSSNSPKFLHAIAGFFIDDKKFFFAETYLRRCLRFKNEKQITYHKMIKMFELQNKYSRAKHFYLEFKLYYPEEITQEFSCDYLNCLIRIGITNFKDICLTFSNIIETDNEFKYTGYLSQLVPLFDELMEKRQTKQFLHCYLFGILQNCIKKNCKIGLEFWTTQLHSRVTIVRYLEGLNQKYIVPCTNDLVRELLEEEKFFENPKNILDKMVHCLKELDNAKTMREVMYFRSLKSLINEYLEFLNFNSRLPDLNEINNIFDDKSRMGLQNLESE